MKLTKDQLRRIVRESVQRKLRALDEAESLEEGRLNNPVVDLVGGALAQQLNELFEREGGTVESNAYEMVAGTPDPDVVAPARYEDLRDFADACAEVALAEVKDQVHEMAFGILQSLMEPSES